MNRYTLLQVLYHAAELFTEEGAVGTELGEHVALAGFHDQDGTIYTVTVSQVEPPTTPGTGIRKAEAAKAAPHKGRLN